jgi:sugar/nucleoside kinase (ribokinase family)
MHAIFLNAREATGLTDTSTVEDAGASLAQMADTVIITQAREGALQFHEGEITRYSYRAVDNPVDTTGAGDLLAAAYIWADLRGADPGDRLRWAVVYATLAVMSPSGIGGAVSEAELVRAGIEADLVPPPLAGAYAR